MSAALRASLTTVLIIAAGITGFIIGRRNAASAASEDIAASYNSMAEPNPLAKFLSETRRLQLHSMKSTLRNLLSQQDLYRVTRGNPDSYSDDLSRVVKFERECGVHV